MSVNREAVLTMINCMQIHACTYKDLAEASGMKEAAVRNWVTSMCKIRDGKRLAHRCAWDKSHNTNIAMFKWGNGFMLKPPPKLTSSEKTKRYRANKKLRERHGALFQAVVGRVH